jgi:hypothetical protein
MDFLSSLAAVASTACEFTSDPGQVLENMVPIQRDDVA